MDWITLLYVAIPSLFAGGGGVWFIFYKQNKRLKTAEATAKEVEVLHEVVTTLQGEISRMQEKQKALEDRLTDKDGVISLLYRQIEDNNKKYHIKKMAINCAISCGVANNECPVLLKLAELEK